MFDTWCRWMFHLFLHKIAVYRRFSYFQYGFQNGHQRSRDYFYYYWFKWKYYILATFCESFTAIGWMVLEILCVEPIYPQYPGVLETCLTLRYWFFELLGSESVKKQCLDQPKSVKTCIFNYNHFCQNVTRLSNRLRECIKGLGSR